MLRFDTLGITSTEQTRRTYREMLGAASLGSYTDDMEETLFAAEASPHRREWRDD